MSTFFTDLRRALDVGLHDEYLTEEQCERIVAIVAERAERIARERVRDLVTSAGPPPPKRRALPVSPAVAYFTERFDVKYATVDSSACERIEREFKFLARVTAQRERTRKADGTKMAWSDVLHAHFAAEIPADRPERFVNDFHYIRSLHAFLAAMPGGLEALRDRLLCQRSYSAAREMGREYGRLSTDDSAAVQQAFAAHVQKARTILT